jgi:4-methylaminobutanoate oxidase (formaldehyde-forming)
MIESKPIEKATVVIIGGGVLGCSIAWHLARAGQSDVVVLERNDIGSAATARAAGLVARGRLHVETLRFVARTREAMKELEAENAQPVGFQRVGTLRVAVTEQRAADLEKMDGLLREHGVDARKLDANEARELVPWLEASHARRISYVADDGYIDGYTLADAYAKAARARGVRIHTRTTVTRILHDGERVTGVETDKGRIDCENVVLAGGAWGIPMAASMGVPLGTAPVRSHYWITAAWDGAPRDHPVVYLPDARAYSRPEVGGLLLGVQESSSRSYDARTLPDDIAQFPLSEEGEEWSALVEHADTLRPYMPRLDELPLAHHITGLSTYTPDGRFILGEAGKVRGFFVASGCCGTGVSASGGIGEALASLVLRKTPPVDLSSFDPARFAGIDPYDPAFREKCAAARAGKRGL